MDGFGSRWKQFLKPQRRHWHGVRCSGQTRRLVNGYTAVKRKKRLTNEEREKAKVAKHIVDSATKRARQLGAIRTSIWVDRDKVPKDPITNDAFQRACERGLAAWKNHDPHAKDPRTGLPSSMPLLHYIDAAIFGHDSKDFFETPLSIGKNVILDFLKAARSSPEVYEQRTLFEELGHDPLDFDTICTAGAPPLPPGPPSGSDDFEPDDFEGEPFDIPDSTEVGSTAFDLDIEAMLAFESCSRLESACIWLRYFPRVTAAQFGDLVPDDLLVDDGYAPDYLRTGDVDCKVSRIIGPALKRLKKFDEDA